MTGKQLKDSILQMAVQGNLVSQDPHDEPASVLLEHIQAAKKQLIQDGKINKERIQSRIFRGPDKKFYEQIGEQKPLCIETELPFEIPESWEWVRLKSLGEIIGGGTPKSNVDEYWINGTIPWLTPADMKFVKGKYVSKGERNITEAGLKSSSARLMPKGTVIYSSRAPIGYIAIASNEICTNQGFKSVVPFLPELSDYLYYCLIALTPDIQVRASGTTFKEISGSKFGETLIPLPSYSEQRRIILKIEKLLPVVQEYGNKEEQVDKLNTVFPNKLKKSILQYAIQGKLVTQDPQDEPASVLLEHIHKEKEKLIQEGKIKRDKHESFIFRRGDSYYEKLGKEEHCIEQEIPFEIPNSWEWVRIQSIFMINPRNELSDDINVGFIPMKLIKEGFNNSFDYEIRKWHEVKSGFTHLSDNDLVIAKITPCFQNRKSAILKGLPNGYAAGSTELFVLRDITNMLYMPYFLWLCKSNYFIESGIKSFTGTAGQQRVGKDYVANFLAPIPPLREQKHIVKKIEEIYSEINCTFSSFDL